jgi:glycine/D-amino acid oxidase-like deaminating enzyme
MRAKIAPARGTMSAQRPGTSLTPTTQDGQRSFVFYPGGFGYDYLTQLPTGEHELMFGGGWAAALDGALENIGLADDSAVSVSGASHLAGALPEYFGSDAWGREKAPVKEEGGRWASGRTKARWSGILGISADGLPWVGRMPQKVTGRREPPTGSAPLRKATKGKDGASESRVCPTAAPGEWISAGYTGEGMVQAWMSGKAVAHMLLGEENEVVSWFPEVLRMTEERWKKANFEEFIARRMGGMDS